jgi:AraC family transcriptional regulator
MPSVTRRYGPARFPAPVVRSRTAGGFVLSETRYASGASLRAHAHEYACLVVVLEGGFHERREGSTRTGEPGTVIVRPEGEPHSNRFSGQGGRCLNVELPPRWLAGMSDLPIRPAASGGRRFGLLGRRLHGEFLTGDDLSPLAVESHVLGILSAHAEPEGQPAGPAPRWLLRIRDRIQDDPAARFTLAGLASEAGVHPVHLATTFRRYFGRPLASTVRRLRLEMACRLLSHSDLPIAEVALMAGFADQSHLGRALRTARQVTPAVYRAASRDAAAP